MATQTKSNPINDSVEAAAERVAELNEKAVALNEKAVENSRKAGAAYLTSYETAVVKFADSYERAAGATKVDWVADLATAQADFTREVTKAYTGAVRELVS
jgi:hypothetical protein